MYRRAEWMRVNLCLTGFGAMLGMVSPRAFAEAPSPLARVALAMPDLPTPVNGMRPFSVTAAGDRAWVSAQTYIVIEPGNSDHGPLVLWERSDAGQPFVPAIVPVTSIAYFPELCAVSGDEAYVALQDGPESRGRIFARRPGANTPTFIEVSSPEPARGYHFTSTHLSCFADGNLWLWGAVQPGNDFRQQLPYIFHRQSAESSWEMVPVPDEVVPSAGGVDAALLRPDGSGYYMIVKSDRHLGVFDRQKDGQWREVLSLDPGNIVQVLTVAGDPDGEAVAGLLTTDGVATYLQLHGGRWSVVSVGTPGEINAVSGSSGQFVLGGGRAGATAILHAATRMPATQRLAGTVFRMHFDPLRNHGLAVIGNSGTSDGDGLFSW